MSLPSQPSETDSPTESAAPRAPIQVNPSISATLVADYEALQNDVQQANELAADFQRQLAGKSNDFALLKQVFEKTREDLGHLHAGIAALREERHRLANEAMKSAAYQMKLAKTVAERDRLRIDLEVIRGALGASQEEMTRFKDEITRCVHQRDKQIAELTVENVTLKQALVDAQRRLVESVQAASVAAASARESQNLPEISFS